MLTESFAGELLETHNKLEALKDLEQNTPDAIQKLRSHMRIRIKSKITLQPANSSDRSKVKVQGVMGDISSGGCQALFPMPIGVGDVYWLTFDREKLDLEAVVARCLRCCMIREDAFEAGFRFFNPLDLSDAIKYDMDDLIARPGHRQE